MLNHKTRTLLTLLLALLLVVSLLPIATSASAKQRNRKISNKERGSKQTARKDKSLRQRSVRKNTNQLSRRERIRIEKQSKREARAKRRKSRDIALTRRQHQARTERQQEIQHPPVTLATGNSAEEKFLSRVVYYTAEIPRNGHWIFVRFADSDFPNDAQIGILSRFIKNVIGINPSAKPGYLVIEVSDAFQGLRKEVLNNAIARWEHELKQTLPKVEFREGKP